MKISSKQKLIAWILGFVVVLILVVALLIVPQFGRLGDLDEQITQAEMDYDSAEALLARRQGAKSRAHETEARALRLSNEIPEFPELPSLIIELQDAVNESGLEFARLSPGTPVAGEGQQYQTLSVAMNVGGTWQDYVDLLQRLRRITRQIRIVSMSVVPIIVSEAPEGETEIPDTSVGVELIIEAYTMETEAAPSGTTAPPPPG